MSTYTYNPNDYQAQSTAQVVVQQSGIDINSLLLYQIKGKPAFAYADIHVQPNQRVITDGNMMLFMDAGMSNDVGTECWGGCCDAITRSWAGEKCCFNTFTNTTGENRQLTVGYTDPGDMLSFGVTQNNGWILTKDAFVAGTDNLEVKGKCVACCAGMYSGEGFFLTNVRLKDGAEAGVFLAGSYGALVRHDIPEGQVLYVTKGLFFAAHETTKFRMGLAGDLKNLCCSKGAICMKFYGPSVVYTQSRDPLKWNPYKHRPSEPKKQKAGVH
jgi:uncharacterized protein (TIGR00266 family)